MRWPWQQAGHNEAVLALRDTVCQQLVRGDYTGIWNTLSHLEESPQNRAGFGNGRTGA